MPSDAAVALAEATRGYLMAPAGCGKTHAIAEAVSLDGRGRQLVLTHTHAGVRSLRTKLAKLGVPPSRYRVDTIDGWSLQIARAWPSLSGLEDDGPLSFVGDDYKAVHRAATVVLGARVCRTVVDASYQGLYVDEYQDCTIFQHALIRRLADLLPCRVLGDPLQGIFSFADAVDWRNDVEAVFAELPRLTTPYRWQDTSPGLGEWLLSIRPKIEGSEGIDLAGAPAPVTRVPQTPENQRHVCWRLADSSQRDQCVVAIHAQPNQCHAICKQLGGRYTVHETVECPDLMKFATKYDAAVGRTRAAALLTLAHDSMTGLRARLGAAFDSIRQGRHPNVTSRAKHPTAIHLLIRCNEPDATPEDAALALEGLSRLPQTNLTRRELIRDAIRALRLLDEGAHSSLKEAALQVRDDGRRFGRRIANRIVSTTLRVKGLEFEHAVVLDADALDAHNLYVALTRGSRSLTILSGSPVLQPTMGGKTKTTRTTIRPTQPTLGLAFPNGDP